MLRFKTFVSANSVSEDKLALVFLTNQTSDAYTLINNYVSQQDTPTTADNMQFSDIVNCRIHVPALRSYTKFTVRETYIQYNFWSSIKRQPGETPTELAARVRQMVTTCDFPAIKNLLDEAMKTCFICAINNEAVLKSGFRKPEEKLTFSTAVDITTEVEEAAKTAKAQVYSKPEEVHKIQTKKQYHHHQKSSPSSKQPSSTQTECYCCGKKGHAKKDCRLSNQVCKFCSRKGHIEAACITKQKSSKVSLVTKPTINKLDDTTTESSPSYQLPSTTGSFHSWWIHVASCNLVCKSTWKKIRTPRLQKDETRPLISQYRITSFQLPGQLI